MAVKIKPNCEGDCKFNVKFTPSITSVTAKIIPYHSKYSEPCVPTKSGEPIFRWRIREQGASVHQEYISTGLTYKFTDLKPDTEYTIIAVILNCESGIEVSYGGVTKTFKGKKSVTEVVKGITKKNVKPIGKVKLPTGKPKNCEPNSSIYFPAGKPFDFICTSSKTIAVRAFPFKVLYNPCCGPVTGGSFVLTFSSGEISYPANGVVFQKAGYLEQGPRIGGQYSAENKGILTPQIWKEFVCADETAGTLVNNAKYRWGLEVIVRTASCSNIRLFTEVLHPTYPSDVVVPLPVGITSTCLKCSSNIPSASSSNNPVFFSSSNPGS